MTQKGRGMSKKDQKLSNSPSITNRNEKVPRNALPLRFWKEIQTLPWKDIMLFEKIRSICIRSKDNDQI